MGVRILNDGEDPEDLLGKMRERAQNLGPVTRALAADFDSWIKRDVFGKETSPFGEGWKPLSKTTVEMRRKGKGNAPDRILFDTGALFRNTFAKGLGGGVYFGVTGAPAEYGPEHLTPGPFGRPARVFLPVNEDATDADFDRGPAKQWLEDAMQAVEDYIFEGRFSLK